MTSKNGADFVHVQSRAEVVEQKRLRRIEVFLRKVACQLGVPVRSLVPLNATKSSEVYCAYSISIMKDLAFAPIKLRRELTHFSLPFCLRNLPIFIVSALGLCLIGSCTLQREQRNTPIGGQSEPQIGRDSIAQINGSWRFALTLEQWIDQARVELQVAGETVIGQYSGVLGMNKAVNGTYKDRQLSLSFEGEWPTNATVMEVKIKGDLANDLGSGTFRVANLGEGTWKANRLKPGGSEVTGTLISGDVRSQNPGASWKITAADLPKPGGPTFSNALKLVARPHNVRPQAPDG